MAPIPAHAPAPPKTMALSIARPEHPVATPEGFDLQSFRGGPGSGRPQLIRRYRTGSGQPGCHPRARRSQEGSTKGRTGEENRPCPIQASGLLHRTAPFPTPRPSHRVTDRPRLKRAEGVETRIAFSHRTDVPEPPQELGRGNRTGYEARR